MSSVKINTYDSNATVFNVTTVPGDPPAPYLAVYGSLLSAAEYGFGVPVSGAPTRTTSTAFLWQQNAAYLTAGLTSLPASTTVLNSSGQQASYTTYKYDETSFSPGGVLGLPTTTIRYLAGSPGPTTHTGWLADGEKSYIIDADANKNGNGHTADYQYNQCAGSVLTDTYDALNHHTSGSYDCSSGLITSVTDPNGQMSQFRWDNMGRILYAQSPTIPLPGGATGVPTTSFQYNDASRTVTRTVLATPDPTQTTQVVFDGLGREIHRYTTDSSQSDTVDTTYDNLGRTLSVSNPHRSSFDSTYGISTFTYDALGRKILETQPDGSSLQWCYDGVPSTAGQTICSPNSSTVASASWVDSSNETGRHWQHVSDWAGHLVAAVEPNPSTNALGLETDYAYDALNNLLSVNQKGLSTDTPHIRSFTYDSLSRLLCASNPENNNPNGSSGNTYQPCPSSSTGAIPSTGVTSYGYDLNGNLLLKTDARGISARTTYDVLNRPLIKTYSDGLTPSASYTYDASNVPGAANTVGRLTGESTSNGPTLLTNRSFFAYDALGHLNGLQECSPANCTATPYAVSYLYDLAGNVAGSTNGLPSSSFNGVSVPSVSLGMSYDMVGRLGTLTSSWTDATVHPATLFQANSTSAAAPGYTAAGALENAVLGVNSITSQLTATLARTYDNRLRPTSETDTSSAVVLAPATPSTGSITISGTEQQGTSAAVFATAQISITGAESSHSVCVTKIVYINGGKIPTTQTTCTTISDTGTLAVTVNGFTGSATYGATSSDPSVAKALAGALSLAGSPVKALASSNVVTMTSLVAGTAGNYAYTVTNGADFSAGTGSTMSGGAPPGPVYDTGTISLTIGSTPVTVSWGSGTSAQSLANSVLAALPTSYQGSVTQSGPTWKVNLQSQQTGTSANVSIGCSAVDTDTMQFSSASFLVECNGMTGGAGAGYVAAPIYSYSIPSGTGYAANGNVLNFTDSVVGSWMYSYDDLNRLAFAGGSSGSFNGQNAFTVQGAEFSWGYDSFGNRLTQGSNVSTLQSGAWAHYTAATNQVTAVPGGSLSYDNAGDVTNDTVNQYAYDAEARVCAVWSGSTSSYTGYIYDGEGDRVAKGSINGLNCNLATNGFSLTKSYIYGGKGELLTEMGAAGVWNHSNVYADGRLLATYEGNDTYFSFNDWLGTKRVQFTPDSCMTAWASLPFGDDLTTSSTCPDASEQHFTGKERDTESGLDYFGARYYGSNMGRFMSPDWSAKAQAVPYAKMDNPQTLNLYQYMRNNPLSGADPDGHCDWCQKLWNGITGNGFQTNAQIAQTAALNAPTTVTETETYTPMTNLELGPGMAEAIEGEKSNSLVDLASSAAGLLSAIPGVPAQVGLPAGALSTGVSVANDPSNGLNNGINATGQALAITSAVAEGTAFGTGASVAGFGVAAGATAWSASNFISNIVTTVFSPPPEAMNINGTTVQQPDLSDIPH